MKLKFILTATVASVAVAAFTGCSDSSKSTSPEAGSTNSMAAVATNAADAASSAAAATVSAVSNAATSVAGMVATNTPAAATAQPDDIIAQAKSLIADKKYTDALTALNGLSGTTLSAEQQKLVDELKTQIQQAMTGGAASAVQGLMPK